MQVAPCERAEDPGFPGRLLRCQRRRRRNQSQIRPVAGPGLSDPQRPRQEDGGGLRRPEVRLCVPVHFLHRRRWTDSLHRSGRERFRGRWWRGEEADGAEDSAAGRGRAI